MENPQQPLLLEGKSDEEILEIAQPLLAEMRDLCDTDLTIEIGATSYTPVQLCAEILNLTSIGRTYLNNYLLGEMFFAGGM